MTKLFINICLEIFYKIDASKNQDNIYILIYVIITRLKEHYCKDTMGRRRKPSRQKHRQKQKRQLQQEEKQKKHIAKMNMINVFRIFFQYISIYCDGHDFCNYVMAFPFLMNCVLKSNCGYGIHTKNVLDLSHMKSLYVSKLQYLMMYVGHKYIHLKCIILPNISIEALNYLENEFPHIKVVLRKIYVETFQDNLSEFSNIFDIGKFEQKKTVSVLRTLNKHRKITHILLKGYVPHILLCYLVNLMWKYPGIQVETDSGLIKLSSTEIVLNGFPKILSKRIILQLKQSLDVESFNISGCKNITYGVFEYLERFTKLTKLNICDVDLTEAALKSLSRLSNLISINLANCRRLTNAVIISLVKNCKKLQFVDLSRYDYFYRYYYLNDTVIQTLAENCHDLLEIILRGCVNITCFGIQSLAKYCHDLRSINLQGCVLITDQAIESLRVGCRKLETINLSGCTEITNIGMCFLSEFEHLHSIHLMGCLAIITRIGLRFILKCKSLHTLSINLNKNTKDVLRYLRKIPQFKKRLKSIMLKFD